MSKISCLINTYNSERYLRECLESVKWCDEIVVVDMFSSDNTISIARDYGTKIYFHEYCGYVEPARKFGVSHCSHEWVLIIDSDEIIPPLLKDILIKIKDEGIYDVVLISRRNFIFGDEIHGAGWGFDQDLHPRFFKKGYIEFSDEIHRGFKIVDKARIKKIVKRDLSIIHFNYDSVSQFIKKINVYTEYELKSNKLVKVKSPLVSMLYHF